MRKRYWKHEAHWCQGGWCERHRGSCGEHKHVTPEDWRGEERRSLARQLHTIADEIADEGVDLVP